MKSEIGATIYKLILSIINIYESGEDIENSECLLKLFSYLESLISRNLKIKYSEWSYESLDGIYSKQITIKPPNYINIIGMCILISDQSLLPIYIEIKLSEIAEEVEYLLCKLGEFVNDGIKKIPYSSNKWKKQLYTLDKNIISWYYNFECMEI